MQAALVLLIVMVIAALGFMPLDSGDAPSRPPKASKAVSSGQGSKLPPVDYFAVIYQRDLRKPLIEAVIAPPPPPPPPKLTISLVGTAVDPGYTCALFRMANGEVHTASVGEKVEEALVTEIVEGAATVQMGGQTFKLTVDKTDKNDKKEAHP